MRDALVRAALIAVMIGYYPTACLIWPLARCWRCKGKGRHEAWWGGKAFRPCWRCKGSGSRVRIGRRIFNYFWNNRANR